jgi:hypothetical protein
MADAPAAIALLGEPTRPAGLSAEESNHALVLGTYEGILARSLNERNAFEAAVRSYRSQSPGLPEEDARRAVANIICRKS